MGFHENLIQSFINFRDKYLKASDNLIFKFTKDATTGKYGYLDTNGNFIPFKTTHTLTKTVNSGTSAQTVDMGEDHEYRYVSVNAITPNLSNDTRYQHASNNGTPTLMGDAGFFTTVYDRVSKINLGNYFEIRFNGSKNKSNVNMTAGWMNSNTLLALPSQTKTITASRSQQTVTPDSNKVLQSVTVNKYPDASGTYGTITSNGTKDMGATNNYRYVRVSVNQTPSFSWQQIVDGTTSTTTVSCRVGDIIIVQRGDNAGAASVSNATYLGSSHRNDNVYYYRATSTSVTVTTGMYYTTIGKLSWQA